MTRLFLFLNLLSFFACSSTSNRSGGANAFPSDVSIDTQNVSEGGENAPVPAEIKTMATQLIEGEWVKGAALGIVVGDEIQFYGFGEIATNEPRTPDADTLFEIGSITKTFTGLLFALAVQEGENRLDQSIAEFLPESANVDDSVRSITFEQLATHTSGLPRLPPGFSPSNPEEPYADYDEEKLLSALSQVELAQEPGYLYSNFGVGLLGYLLSRNAGLSYEELLRQKIFEPLELSNTTITISEAQRSRLASGHNSALEPVAPWNNMAMLAGAGAIRSSARDMVDILRAYLSPPAEFADAMHNAIQRHYHGTDHDVGLGWHLDGEPSRVWHNGQTAGFHSFTAFRPDRNVGVVVLANTSASVVDAFGQAVLLFLLGEPYRFELPPSLLLEESILETYVGQYQLAPNVLMTITREGSRLFLQVTGQPRFRLYAKSETEFYVRVVQASGTFVLGEDGRAEKLIWHQGNQDIEAPRVE